AGPAAADRRALLAERGVGERLQRLIQVAQLVGDDRQLLARFLAAVEALKLLDDAVEPLEQRLEAAVCKLPVFHQTIERSTPTSVDRPPTAPRARRRRAARGAARARPGR